MSIQLDPRQVMDRKLAPADKLDNPVQTPSATRNFERCSCCQSETGSTHDVCQTQILELGIVGDVQEDRFFTLLVRQCAFSLPLRELLSVAAIFSAASQWFELAKVEFQNFSLPSRRIQHCYVLGQACAYSNLTLDGDEATRSDL